MGEDAQRPWPKAAYVQRRSSPAAIAADQLPRAELAALADRFATVLTDAGSF